MNAMGHSIPNVLGVSQDGVEGQIRKLLPGYMAMGETGMAEHAEHANHMQGPDNTLPMMGGEGPFGNVGMGGMFTILKVRDQLKEGEDPGWYPNPPGTVASQVGGAATDGSVIYVCPMHPEVRQSQPGSCPKCGMTLRPERPETTSGADPR